MLSRGDTGLLPPPGPATPMGRLMRRYWLPAVFSDQIARPDSPPVRVRLLGEKLVAFRDTQGRVGLLDERCPHRTASLYFGRNEECGLRCVYHGWKFDVDGACVDMPSEPPGGSFQHKVRIKSYPCVERAGIGEHRNDRRDAAGQPRRRSSFRAPRDRIPLRQLAVQVRRRKPAGLQPAAPVRHQAHLSFAFHTPGFLDERHVAFQHAASRDHFLAVAEDGLNDLGAKGIAFLAGLGAQQRGESCFNGGVGGNRNLCVSRLGNDRTG